MDSIVPLFQITTILCILLNSFSLSTLKREEMEKFICLKNTTLEIRYATFATPTLNYLDLCTICLHYTQIFESQLLSQFVRTDNQTKNRNFLIYKKLSYQVFTYWCGCILECSTL